MGINFVWVLFIALAIASFVLQYRLKAKFKKYAQISLPNGITGKDVARMMLAQNHITDVTIQATGGMLTDYYNPTNKTVNLSQDVYDGNSIAAAAVAAHECGHAVQHAESYVWLKLRSALVPAVSFASSWMQWVLLAGILLVQTFPQLLMFGVALFALTTIFSFITLPVEINASQRALVWLSASGLTDASSDAAAKDALKTAAYTYVVAALSSLATLVYYLLILFGGRRD